MNTFKGMLALVAVVLSAAACGSSTTTPAATTDTTAVTDVAADTTSGTDAATDATKTGSDTTVVADTSTMDMNMGTDTTVTTGPVGCTGTDDKAFLTSLADATKKGKIATDLQTCTLKKGCLTKATDNDKIKCISDCFEGLYSTSDKITNSCSDCFGLTGWCGVNKCLTDCAVDASSKACGDCIATNCDPLSGACNAGTCDPYGATHCGPAK